MAAKSAPGLASSALSVVEAVAASGGCESSNMDHVPAEVGLDGPDDVARLEVSTWSNSGSANSGTIRPRPKKPRSPPLGAAAGVVALGLGHARRTRPRAGRGVGDALAAVARPAPASAWATVHAGSVRDAERWRGLGAARVVLGRVQDVAGVDLARCRCPAGRRVAGEQDLARWTCGWSPVVASATTLSSSSLARVSRRTFSRYASQRHLSWSPGSEARVIGRGRRCRHARRCGRCRPRPVMSGVVLALRRR